MLSVFGSEKDKERLLKASRHLYDSIYTFVSSTNTIFRMLNQYIGSELAIFTVKENLSIKENLQLLGSSLKEMQEIVVAKDKDVKQKVSLPLYSKITVSIRSTDEKIKLIKDINGQYQGDLGSICGPICAVIIKNGNLPEKLDNSIRDLMNSPVLSLRVGELLMTHEEIAKALPDSSATSSHSVVPVQARSRSQSVITSTFSLTNFMRAVLRTQPCKNTIELAADCLEDAVKALKPGCESFHSTVKMAEEYVTLIIDKMQ
ncbi:uncharacterized protein C12orf60 homolog [Elgaria multicarinata webbii]|uniref:uncharacterized protein C12orf60 homolog n=1 Tax=Elgaria multicarinata webbii TaxID=159646 RepID=UPI002FCD2F7A